jgi:phosphoglycerate dehydrogenase-like enzyme
MCILFHHPKHAGVLEQLLHNSFCYVMCSNTWEPHRPQWLMGQDIQGSTIGIVGFGAIGQAIAKRLIPFEVKQIIYSGHLPKPEGRHKGAKQECICAKDTVN